MCGVAGFSLTPECSLDRETLTGFLALSIEHRGTDATGYAWHYRDDNEVFFWKQDKPASEMWDYYHLVGAEARLGLVHTRAATQGSPKFSENNHPIALPGIVGTHNGIIMNDRELVRDHKLVTDGDVDSEVIFHLISRKGLRFACKTLEGDATIAWVEWDGAVDNPDLHLATLGGRPLAIANFSGGMLYASTPDSLEWVADSLELDAKITTIGEGIHMTVNDGTITEVETIPVIESGWNSWGYRELAQKANGPGKSTVVTSNKKKVEVTGPRTVVVLNTKVPDTATIGDQFSDTTGDLWVMESDDVLYNFETEEWAQLGASRKSAYIVAMTTSASEIAEWSSGDDQISITWDGDDPRPVEDITSSLI